VLLCRSLAPGAVPETACCRLAPCHRGEGVTRSRRYSSDTTEAQWAVIDPLLPDPAWLTGHGGRPQARCRRTIVDAIFYVVDNGITWRALPADFPPWSTVYHYFAAWEAAGITQDVLDGYHPRLTSEWLCLALLPNSALWDQARRLRQRAHLAVTGWPIGRGTETRDAARGPDGPCSVAARSHGQRPRQVHTADGVIRQQCTRNTARPRSKRRQPAEDSVSSQVPGSSHATSTASRPTGL
jgi:hypothetical protein